MRRINSVHPLLLAMFPTLFLYSQNVNDYPLSVLPVPLAASLVIALFAWLVLRLILRDAAKTALTVSLGLILFFSYGHLYNIIWYPFAVYPFAFGAQYLLLPLCGLVFLTGFFWLFRTRRDLTLLTRWANYVAVILLVVPVISIGLSGLSSGTGPAAGNDALDEMHPSNTKPATDLPDIYYIIIDGFARADVLADLYDYPNSILAGELERRGFYVADRAGANYCQTALSLASSLNYKYLNPEEDGYDAKFDDRTPLTRKIADNRVMDYLCRRGYTTVAFATGYEPLNLRNADVFLSPGGKVWFLDEFQSGLLETTPLPHLIPDLDRIPLIGGLSHPQAAGWRQMIRRTFVQLGELPVRSSPKFVFAHLLTPHPPFLFGANGEELNPPGLLQTADGNALIGVYLESREEYINSYRNQLIFVEQQVLTMVDAILADSHRPPIIILQADHGPGAYLDWNSSDRTDARERLGILSAHHLPDHGDSLLYETITPVNTFRVIFKHYFGENLALLPDESYYSPWKKPYWFTVVGDRVRGAAPRRSEPAALPF